MTTETERYEPLATLPEIAELLAVKHQAVYRLVADRRIPVLRVGRLLRFDREAVLEAIGEVGRRE